MVVKVEALDHLVINVADVAATAEWYGKILGMEVKVFDPGGGKAPRTSLVFGNQKINVRPRDADKVEWFTADHQTAGSEGISASSPPPRPMRWWRICRHTVSRSRKARFPSRARAARCARSIAGIRTAA
ncbi:catechol 2,3-dioxygenase-like lactoylglutathione lyase family enzyme [Bradyrhizobium ottawaense]